MLKIILMLKFVLLFVVCTNGDRNIAHFGFIENNVLKLINEFKNRMCHDLDRFGLPALDPFTYKRYDFSFQNSLADVSGSVSDVESKGLSDVEIGNLVVKQGALAINLTATIQELSLKAKFKLKGALGELFPIDGNGEIKIVIEELKIVASFKVHSADKVYIKELAAKPAVKKVNANIEGLVPDKEINDFINDVINDKGSELLDALWEDIEADAIGEIEKLSKFLFRSVTSRDVSRAITGKPVFTDKDPAPNCKESKPAKEKK